MARKTGADAAKAKAAKQKKIVIALSVVLVLALAYAYRTMQSLGGGQAAPPAPATATAPATTTTAAPPAVPSTAAPAPAAPAPAGQPVAAAPTQLVDAVKPSAGTGQLQTFSHFESKDPFAAQGPKPAGASGSAAAPPKPVKVTVPPAPPPASALIAVNGLVATVQSGSDFPASSDTALNGIFQLVGLTATTAKVAIAGGSYASGEAALTLQANKPVTLVNTADGKQYTLQLYPQGTASAAPTTPATAIPATTTPVPGG